MRRRQKKKLKIIFILVCSIIICLKLIFPAIKTFSRYVYDNIKGLYLESRDFYFNSDKLNKEMAEYEVHNWSGVEDYEIVINMDSRKNNNVVSTSDINYKVEYKCSDNVICTLSKQAGTIPSKTNVDQFKLTLTPKGTLNDGDSVWVEIVTNAISPYTSTLSGKFVINVGNLGMSYEINDQKNSPYLELAVTNTLNYYFVDEDITNFKKSEQITIEEYLSLSEEERKKCHSMIISLEFDPTKVLLDPTSEVFRNQISSEYQEINGYKYLKSISFKIDAESSNKISFYKIDSTKDYTYPFKTQTPIITVEYT